MPESAPSSPIPPSGPIAPPPGAEIVAATARGLSLRSPHELPEGRLVEFELLLGARPVEAIARVVSCRSVAPQKYAVELEFVAMAQVDRDSVADFLQAVGLSSLRIRERRKD